MPTHPRRPFLPFLILVVLLAQLLTGCAVPAPILPATATLVSSPPAPISLPTLTPRPARTPFIMPTTPLYGSQTPTPVNLRPTVTPLPVKEFSMLAIQPLQEQFQAYRPIELAIQTDGSAANPFDPAQADLSVRFRGPSGQEQSAPAFWYQDFDPLTLLPRGDPGWRARFTPPEAGEWSAEAVMRVPVVLTSAALRLSVQPDTAARGFVRVSEQDPRYLAFDDGSFYFPVGLNMGWAGQDVLGDYTKWLDHLSQNGGNYIRVWMASWSFALEWDDTGLGNYSNRLQRAWLLDQVFKLAEERGVYVMLCMVNHGAFSATTNPEWGSNPYNAALGGPLEFPEEFVSNLEAKELFKRRVRYIAARWAYSPNLAIWEWWNEVHWTPIPEKDLMPWIAEMTAELKKHDPYDHLVSTSFGGGTNNATWSMLEIDLAQQHEYSTSDALRTLPVTLRQFDRTAAGKPVLLAEYGSSAEGESAPYNRDAIHLHNGLWAAPFAGYAGTGMYWWWDNYIEPLNLWYQYRGIAEFFRGEDLRGMTPSAAAVTPAGASALALQTTQRALVWVRADGYTFEAARRAYNEAGSPAEWKYELPGQSGLRVQLTGLKNGDYQVLWYSTLDGPSGESETLTVTDGTLRVALPVLTDDLAFKAVLRP